MAVDSSARGLALKTKKDLETYYYTKGEVDALVAATADPVVVTELPAASEATRKKLYMVGPKGTAPNIYYEEYITIRTGSEGSYVYTWEPVGSTAGIPAGTAAGQALIYNGTGWTLQDGYGYITPGTGETITWDGSTASKESVIDVLYKMTDNVPASIGTFTGATLSVYADGTTTTATITGSTEISTNCYSLDASGVDAYPVIALADGTIYDVPITKGIWFLKQENTYVSSLSYGTQGVTHKIDPQYIPVAANPALAGTESELSGLQIGNTKYKIPNDVFVATYGTTTHAEILAAHNAGKYVICHNEGLYYALCSITNSLASFYALNMADNIPAAGIVGVTSDNTWSELGTDLQSRLVSGTNIKTINGNSLLGAGNIPVKTYQPFPNGEISGTLQHVVEEIMQFPSRAQGMAYLGGIAGSCTPFGYGNVECTVTFMTDNIAVLSASSSNIAPYHWEYNTAQSDYEWRSWEPTMTNASKIIEVGSAGQTQPSADLVVGGLFLERK